MMKEMQPAHHTTLRNAWHQYDPSGFSVNPGPHGYTRGVVKSPNPNCLNKTNQSIFSGVSTRNILGGSTTKADSTCRVGGQNKIFSNMQKLIDITKGTVNPTEPNHENWNPNNCVLLKENPNLIPQPIGQIMQPKDGDKLSCNHKWFSENEVWFDETDKRDLFRQLKKLIESDPEKDDSKISQDRIYNEICERDDQFGKNRRFDFKLSCQALLLGEQKRGFIEHLRDWFSSDLSSLEDQKFYFQLTQLLKNYNMDCFGTYKRLLGEEEVGNGGVGPACQI
jgi:hypothetical protein